jgi:hypothetical protein
MVISGLLRGFSTCCLRFTNGVATIHARLASAGWLAFTGRELNPLDRDEGFQIKSSSSLPGLFLAQRPKTCTVPDVRLRLKCSKCVQQADGNETE